MMQEMLLQYYLWFKAVHIIAFVSWMAGLLYLPRLFVYHCRAAQGGEAASTFKIMEHRLYNFIMRPAMIVTWLSGLSMLYANHEALLSSGWMHVKLTLVIALTGVHHVFGAWRKKFGRDENNKSEKFYRVWNEV
ncbi:MAG: protoporphyrinogen oxidase HemJ, partial [Micavibrio sp.]